MNIVDVCRICLEKSSANKKTLNIFSENGNSHFPLMIMACASVQILEGDGLPTSICQICIAKLNVAFDFKQQCESSDAKLRLQYFGNSQHVQITPDLSDFTINIKEEQKPITFQNDSQIIAVNNVMIEQDRCNNDVIPQTQILIPLLKEESQQNTILQTLNNSSRNQLILEQSQEKSDDGSLAFHKSENKNFMNLSNIKNDSITSRPGRKKNSNKRILSQAKNDETRVPKVHQCDTCGKTFNRREYLTQHIRIHTGEKPYFCHLCDKRFINSGHLTTHMRTHTGERPHSCSLCPKAFSTRQELHKHTMVHNGERPFICKMCGKRFGSSSNLYSHLKHHTGEKNFTCEHCGKAFYTKQELKQHFVVHTGEKAFLCECCNKRFSQIAHLRRHAKLHK